MNRRGLFSAIAGLAALPFAAKLVQAPRNHGYIVPQGLLDDHRVGSARHIEAQAAYNKAVSGYIHRFKQT